MSQSPKSMLAENRIAALAIAQFLVVEAIIESVDQLQDMATRRRHPHTPGQRSASAGLDVAQLTEPYRVRFELFKQLFAPSESR